MAPNVFPVTPSTPNSSQKNRSRAAPWNPKISAARKARLPELLGNPRATNSALCAQRRRAVGLGPLRLLCSHTLVITTTRHAQRRTTFLNRKLNRQIDTRDDLENSIMSERMFKASFF